MKVRLGKRLLSLVAATFMLCGSAFAQTNVNEEQGLKPHDTLHGGDLDSVSLTNGSLLLHIPLLSFPQRGKLDLSFSIYSNTKQWQSVASCKGTGEQQTCTSSWAPLPRGGLLPPWGQGPLSFNGGAYVTSSVDWWMASTCQMEPASDPNNPGSTTYDWSRSLVAPDGNVHLFGYGSLGTCSTPPMRSLDATGILWSDANTVIMPNGTRVTMGGPSGGYQTTGPSAVTDPNGNQITINSSGWTDTLGRSIPGSVNTNTKSGLQPGLPSTDLSTCPSGASAANVWNVPGPAGGTRTFKFCYSNVSIYTSFGDGGDSPATTWPLLAAIVLPDLSMWTFSYDHYGDVTRLGLPTGGSITYTYAIGPPMCAIGDTSKSLVVTSRTVDANDGTGGHTYGYNYSGQYVGNPASYSGTAIVTDPDGNDTVHTISAPVAAGACSLFDTQVQYYQGSHTGGTLLKTVATQYSGIANPLETGGDGTAANVVPTQVTSTWADGHTSKVVNTWDSANVLSEMGINVPIVFGSLLQKDEYDYSNALVRSTVNHYLWQDNATYQNNNFLGLKTSTTLKNGAGTQLAQMTYAYDQSGLLSSGIGTPTHVGPPAGEPIRGNLTTTSRWTAATRFFRARQLTMTLARWPRARRRPMPTA
jgi:hypothetical protein